jgi:hypothetical protein
MTDSGSFPIRIFSGLVEPKHFERIGSALWVFLLFVDWVTEEKNGKGFVLGGSAINYDRVKARLPISSRQYNRHIDVLRKEGYIETGRKTGGLKITVLKSKKFPPTSKRNKSDVPYPADQDGSDTPDTAQRSAINGGSDTPNTAAPYRDNTENINKTLQQSWNLLFPIFNIPENSLASYQKQIIDTINRLGSELTLKAITHLKRSPDFRPPEGMIKSIDDLMKWKKIDRIVAALPREGQVPELLFYCNTCEGYVKARRRTLVHCGKDAVDVTTMMAANPEEMKGVKIEVLSDFD